LDQTSLTATENWPRTRKWVRTDAGPLQDPRKESRPALSNSSTFKVHDTFESTSLSAVQDGNLVRRGAAAWHSRAPGRAKTADSELARYLHAAGLFVLVRRAYRT